MKRYFVTLGVALLWCGAVFGTAHAEPVRQEALVIDGVYARATAPGQEVGVVYLVIDNTGAVADRLVSASSPAAQHVALHSSQMTHDMASMHHETSFEIPAHGRMELKPGGLHLMLEGLKKPLKEGDVLSVKLRFERSGEVELTVPVKALMPHDMMH
jgi:copper(I)-binding protein